MQKITQFILISFIISYLFGCTPQTIKSSQNQEESRQVYILQHKIIPKLLYDNEISFYKDLSQGDEQKFRQLVTKVIDQNYSTALQIKKVLPFNGILLTFPEPQTMPHCYYALIAKTKEGYFYFTYEKTFQLGGDDVVGVVGAWTKEGNHMNFGPRTYHYNEDQFLADIQLILSEKIQPAAMLFLGNENK